MINSDTFSNLNFGTIPTTSELEVIVVNVDPSVMIEDYAQAYECELFRRNPIRAGEVKLTKEELDAYFKGLLAIRIESIHGICKVWREAKQLYIPSWVEFTLTCIGQVMDVDRGILIDPQFSFNYDMDVMLATSNKLRSFISDGLSMSKDAMPRGTEGDAETMQMSLVNNYVMSQSKDAHPIFSYVAAYLGLKLKEETSFKALYRVRYDDINFIHRMLLREAIIF